MSSTAKSIQIQKPEIHSDTNGQQAIADDTPPDHAEIERRAYEIYIERGSGHGCDFDDWLQAECELQPKTAVTGTVDSRQN